MQVHLVQYGTSAEIPFSLYDPTGTNLLVSASFQYGDVIFSSNTQSETSAYNIPVDRGSSYYLILSASETQCKNATFNISDTTSTKTWLDTYFIIETYGTSASKHPNIGNITNDIDGVALETVLQDIQANIKGKISKSGNIYTYYLQDGTTVAFILSAGTSGRIPL